MAEEGSLPIGGSTVFQLQSQEQAGLLDAIDQLRRDNIDAEIGIPQIVVCGDQSSGKSSLLEAIAQVPFPAGSGAVTMFATELVMRRASVDAVHASILPSWSRNAEQRDLIAEFQFRPDNLDRDGFKDLYAAASKHLETVDNARGFRYDKLRIEVSGPTQPHLTLIDLPGLIRTTTGRQSPGAVNAIHELTRSYLQKPRTIILAVVSATSDFQVQSVGDLMRSQETAERMMGVITKPDGALSQDDALKMVDLAANEELRLGLGWHVVKNLSHGQVDRSPKFRDDEERNFFTSGVWSRLPNKDLGIGSLRQKLCQRLFESIKRDLPQLIKEMDNELIATRHSIEQLGRVRKNAKDCLWYLSEIQNSMHQLASTASEGVYDDPNVSEFFGKGDYTKLRNLITLRSDLFNRQIRETGKTYFVMGNDYDAEGEFNPRVPMFQPPYYSSRHDEGPYRVRIDAYCSVLAEAMFHNRGKNLPDLYNFRDIQAVFRSQSIRWNSLARAHVEACYDDTLQFMSEAILHIAGPYTSSRLLEVYIQPSMEKRRAELMDKLDELLWPFAKCHPITARPDYATIPYRLLGSNDPHKGEHSDLGTGWSRFSRVHDFSLEQRHAAHVLDRAEAYYEIALDTFIDNVATLAIERVLLRDLPDLISSSCEPSSLSDEQLESVAGESEEVKEQRIKALHRVGALEAVIQTCRQYKGTSRSTPQKIMPQRMESTPRMGIPASKDHTNGLKDDLSKRTRNNDESDPEEISVNLESPATPKAARSQLRSELSPPSPSSTLSSGYRSASSNGGVGTPLSSPRSSSSGQHYNNATGSIAYRSASRSGKHGTSPA